MLFCTAVRKAFLPEFNKIQTSQYYICVLISESHLQHSNTFYSNVNKFCDFYIHFLMNHFHGFQSNITDFLFLSSPECIHYFYKLPSLNFPRDKNCTQQKLGYYKKVVHYIANNQVPLPAQMLLLHVVNMLLPSES